MTKRTKLSGEAAIERAEQRGLLLSKYTDPTEEARDNLTPDEAREVALEDPSLIYLEVDEPALSKRTGAFEDEDTFWAAVAECDWGTRCRQERGYNSLKREILKNWDAAFIGSFRKKVSEKLGEFEEAITKWESHNQQLPVGDDGYSDLKYHIVGLGREVFDATVKSPKLAYKRAQKCDYVESFCYAVPYEEDLPQEMTMEEARTKARAELNSWRSRRDEPGPTEDEVEMRALSLKYGDLVEQIPEYYAARARTELSWVKGLLDSPLAERVGLERLAVLEGALKQMGAGNLAQDWDFLKSEIEALRTQCNAVYEEEEAKIRILIRKGYSLENLVIDAEDNEIGGVR